MFTVRGIQVRTPASWIVNELELGNVKLKIESDAIDKYSIEEYDPSKQVKPKKVVKAKTTTTTPKPVVAKKITEPKTTLEKLAAE
jgi:hypothetical protein